MAHDRRNARIWDGLRTRNMGASTPSVPRGLNIATAYAWRLVVIGVAAAGLIWITSQLKMLVVPFLVALLITALVWPAFSWMIKKRVPRWLAILITIIGLIGVIVGLMSLAVNQIQQQLPDVRAKTAAALGDLQEFLINSNLGITAEDFQKFVDEAFKIAQDQAESLLQGAWAVSATVGSMLTGAILAFFILLCLLADGKGIFGWTLRILPRTARPATHASALLGWKTVVNYARTQLLVATIDAIGIGAVAVGLGIPMAVPVAVLVFLGSFVPFLGAIVTGAIAVFLALIYNGPFIAMWMLIGVLAVQQVESHILQPLIMGHAVKVHPLAVVLSVAGGAMVAGIPGALFAVPLAAFVNVVAVSISSGSWRDQTLPAGDLIWQTIPVPKRARTA